MRRSLRPPPPLRLLQAAGVAALIAIGPWVSGQESDTVALPVLEVSDSAEAQEYWPEERENSFPFRRSGLFGFIAEAEEAAQEEFSILTEQTANLADFAPGEFATASGAAAPRGFTTPRLRNGLNRSGFPEIIIGGRRELLTGFLATYFGRTAPGGILNDVSRRPSPRPNSNFSARLGTRGEARASYERNAPLVPKRLHYRVLGEGRVREGPEDFAREAGGLGGVSFRYAQSTKTVWLVEIDGAWADANPPGGTPLERTFVGGPRGGPYQPLAHFNTNGPDSWSRRASGSASVLAEHAFRDNLRLRAGVEGWQRRQRDLRFNTGPFLVETGLFDGVREPQYNDRGQSAFGGSVELDGSGRIGVVEHRWVVGVFASGESSTREQRGLTRAARDALPVGVRRLDPSAPDWFTPAYHPDTYERLIALRDEDAAYRGFYLSERAALLGERVFGTFGVRGDQVESEVVDRRPGAVVPFADSDVSRITHHAGLVWHTVPNRVATYLNHSTAFQPVRRVDARTGRITGNEGTSGLESGLRYASSDGRFTASWGLYRLHNENITRPNPRYNDPVLDPLGTEPQYVGSGEERFTGSEFAVRARLEGGWTVSAKAVWLEAVTTASPDLPEEVGRQLARLPDLTASAFLRYRFEEGPLEGLELAGSCAWIGDHVAVYESARRNQALVEYGAYGVVDLSAAYGWKVKNAQHAVTVAVRNALDRDLVAAAGRTTGELGLETGYSVRF